MSIIKKRGYMKFNNEINKMRNNNIIILNNNNTGEWIKLSRECYELLERIISERIEEDKVYSLFVNEEDKNYFKLLIKRLKEMNIILSTDNIKNTNSITGASISVTINCNLRCKHCCLSAGNSKIEMLDAYPVLDKISRINIRQLVITGGEPLLRKDIINIMRYAKERIPQISLLTNGTLIDNSLAKFIAIFCQAVSISLDGYDSKSCSMIRGQGIYEQVIKSIKYLQEYGMKNISLSMTITRFTFNHVEEFKELCKNLGVGYVLRRYAPTGRGYDNMKCFIDTVEDNRKLKKELKIKYTDSYSVKSYNTTCGALKYQFHVGSDGWIYPCSGSELSEFKIELLNNIDDIEDYFKNSRFQYSEGYRNFSNILTGKFLPCSNCNICSFCRGCPIYTYLYKKHGILQSYCKNKKQKLENLIWE